MLPPQYILQKLEGCTMLFISWWPSSWVWGTFHLHALQHSKAVIWELELVIFSLFKSHDATPEIMAGGTISFQCKHKEFLWNYAVWFAVHRIISEREGSCTEECSWHWGCLIHPAIVIGANTSSCFLLCGGPKVCFILCAELNGSFVSCLYCSSYSPGAAYIWVVQNLAR